VARILRRPQVLLDVRELAEFIAERSLEAALRFLDSVEITITKLADGPHLGSRCRFENPAMQRLQLRHWPVQGFPKHWVFYRPLSDGIEVVRVLHLARDVAVLLQGESEARCREIM